MESSPKLYEIGGAIQEIDDRLTETEGILDDETEAALDALEGAFNDKVEVCVKAYRNHKAESEMFKNEAARLKRRAEIHNNAAESLRGYMEAVMRRANIKKAGTELHSARFQKNPARVVLPPDFNPAELPVRYVRTKLEPDKKLMLEDHKAGAELPEMVKVEQTESLRIK